MPTTKTRIFGLLASIVLPSICSAQENVSLQFVSFPKSLDPKPIELLVGDGATIEVELPTNSLSKVYKVPALGKWVLGKTVVGPDGKPAFDTYGETPAGPASKQLIMVVRKGQSDAEGLTLVPFDSDGGGFGGGKYIFMNATKVDIAGEIGDSRFALKPRAHTLMAPKASDVKEDRQYLYTTLYFRKGEEATPFYSSTWRFSEKARSMVFFYHDPFNDRLRIHTIRDYLP